MQNLKIQRCKTYLSFIPLLFVLLLFATCKSDDDSNPNNKTDKNSELVGKWQFEISPTNDVKSTEVVKGSSEKDFQSDPYTGKLSFFDKATFENHITPDQSHDFPVSDDHVAGISHFHVFTLTAKANNTFEMKVYQRDSLSHKTGVLVSTINMTKNKSGILEGIGEIHHDVVNDKKGSEETYKFHLRKISKEPSLEHLNGRVERTSLCNIAFTKVAELAGMTTGNVIRPMGGCWGRRDGGGFYMFGNVGPGSRVPLWTQTVYIPQEWSWCKVRKYRFRIKSGGDVHSVAKLKKIIRKIPLKFIRKSFGFSNKSSIERHAEELYEKVGGFAISLGYSTRTGNMSIYFNLKNDKPAYHNIIKNHPLIRGLMSSLDPAVNNLELLIGDNIYDPWHLRRTILPVANHCNSPVIFTYLIGTIKVKYN